MYNGLIEFPEYEPGEMYCGEVTEPIGKYWGLKRIMGYEVPLSGITADNAYEKNLWCIQRISKG